MNKGPVLSTVSFCVIVCRLLELQGIRPVGHTCRLLHTQVPARAVKPQPPICIGKMAVVRYPPHKSSSQRRNFALAQNLDRPRSNKGHPSYGTVAISPHPRRFQNSQFYYSAGERSTRWFNEKSGRQDATPQGVAEASTGSATIHAHSPNNPPNNPRSARRVPCPTDTLPSARDTPGTPGAEAYCHVACFKHGGPVHQVCVCVRACVRVCLCVLFFGL